MAPPTAMSSRSATPIILAGAAFLVDAPPPVGFPIGAPRPRLGSTLTLLRDGASRVVGFLVMTYFPKTARCYESMLLYSARSPTALTRTRVAFPEYRRAEHP